MGKTHFLSFSADLQIAQGFALYDTCKRLADGTMDDYYTYLETDDQWDFALVELHVNKLNLVQVSAGVYEANLVPDLVEFRRTSRPYRIILIDVVTALKNNKDHLQYRQSIENGIRDLEWLVLPAMAMPFESGRTEYSAKLDGACISIVKYKKF